MSANSAIIKQQKEEERRRKEEKLVVARARNAFYSHRRRAREAGRTLDYTAIDLAVTVARLIGVPCPWCEQPLTAKSFSFDHDQPTSRGGSYAAANVLICCTRCNKLKGAMTTYEFIRLQALLDEFPPDIKRNTLARLLAGNRFFAG